MAQQQQQTATPTPKIIFNHLLKMRLWFEIETERRRKWIARRNRSRNQIYSLLCLANQWQLAVAAYIATAAAAAVNPMRMCNREYCAELKFFCINLYLLTALPCSKDKKKSLIMKSTLQSLCLAACFAVLLLLFLLLLFCFCLLNNNRSSFTTFFLQ